MNTKKKEVKEVKEQNRDILAEEANRIIIENKYYQKKLDLYKKYVSLTKDIMTKCLSEKNNSTLTLFNSYINEIQKDYDNLNEEYEKKYFPKYQSLFDECLSDITMGKPVLKQYRAEDFVLDFLKQEKEDLINGLKKSIKQSKEYHLFREPKRDTIIDIKKGNKEIEKTTTELQQNMLYECKQCNKFSHRIKKYNEQIQIIKNNIDILKKYINEEKSKNTIDKISTNNTNINNNNIENNVENNNNLSKEENKEKNKNKFLYGKFDLKGSINIGLFSPSFGHKENKENNEPISDENRGRGSDDRIKKKKSGSLFNNKKNLKQVRPIMKVKNKIISEFKKVEDLFNTSSEDDEKEKLIDDEIHSDDESVFEKKIKQPIKLTISHLNEVKQIIPEINLKQIEYNKFKIMKEDDLYSLQRRKFKSQNIESNIKELKKKIEKLNEKLNYIHRKEKAMKDYVDKKKQEYNTLRKYIRKETSVYKKDTQFIKKSLFGGDYIEEDLNDEMEDGPIGSDYENEEKENSEKESEKERENNFINKINIKGSVIVGRFDENKNRGKKMLKQSVQDGFFKNKLRDKLHKRERAQSK